MRVKYGLAALSNLELLYQGKSRDTFVTKYPDLMLIVATKRISTHNIVHRSLIPRKDYVITMLTIFFMTEVLEKAGLTHHLVAYGKRIYDYLPGKREDYPADLHYRAIVVKKVQIIKIEFIFRAYLSGSFYKDYYAKGLPNPYGIELQPGLPLMWKFPQPIFTPTDKSDDDIPQDAKLVESLYPGATAFARTIFDMYRVFLQSRGLEGVDIKEEIGIDPEGNLVAADEYSPDSSRIVTLDVIREGEEPPWRDKQVARDAAERMWGGGSKYPLDFPYAVCNRLSDRYRGLLEQITGKSLDAFKKEWLD